MSDRAERTSRAEPQGGGLFTARAHSRHVKAVRNERTDTWHLLGSRGCGVDPQGDAFDEPIDGTWAEVRDRVGRDAGGRCRNCRWPPV